MFQSTTLKENKSAVSNGIDLLQGDMGFNLFSNTINSTSNSNEFSAVASKNANSLPNIGNTLVSDLWQ